MTFAIDLFIVTRNNIVWKLARGNCLCYCKCHFFASARLHRVHKIFVTEKEIKELNRGKTEEPELVILKLRTTNFVSPNTLPSKSII